MNMKKVLADFIPDFIQAMKNDMGEQLEIPVSDLNLPPEDFREKYTHIEALNGRENFSGGAFNCLWLEAWKAIHQREVVEGEIYFDHLLIISDEAIRKYNEGKK